MADRDEGRTEYECAGCGGTVWHTDDCPNWIEELPKEVRAEPSGDVGEEDGLERFMVTANALAREVHNRMGPISEPEIAGLADRLRDQKDEARRILARLRRTPETEALPHGPLVDILLRLKQGQIGVLSAEDEIRALATQDPNAGGEDEPDR